MIRQQSRGGGPTRATGKYQVRPVQVQLLSQGVGILRRVCPNLTRTRGAAAPDFLDLDIRVPVDHLVVPAASRKAGEGRSAGLTIQSG